MPPQLPLYRHPTLTVLVDEDVESLRGLARQFSPGHAWRGFSSAGSALVWLDERFGDAGAGGSSSWHRGPAGEPVFLSASMQGELRQIYRYLEDSRRFCAPAVVVIERDMDDMSDLEFCEAVAHLPCKTILFSDNVDGDELGRGLVDLFLRKDPRAVARLETAIATLQNEFFVERTAGRAGRLAMDAFRFLYDDAIVALVDDLCARYGFVEHYLVTKPSGLLFFNVDAVPTLMVVQTEESLMAQFEMARDRGAPTDLLLDLLECRLVPFFQTADGMYRDGLAGGPAAYCRAASLCRGDSDYYWALFDLPPAFRTGQPYSHAQFLRAHPSA